MIIFIIILAIIIVVVICVSNSKNTKPIGEHIPVTEKTFHGDCTTCYNYFKNIKMNDEESLKIYNELIAVYESFEKLKDGEWNEYTQRINNLENNRDKSYLDALKMAMLFRSGYGKCESDEIMLKPYESLLCHQYNVNMYTYQTVYRHVQTAGLRYGKGLFIARDGIVQIDNIKDYRYYDFGQLFATDQRLIFKGKEHTKTISWNSILKVEKYKEDAVLITPSNGSPIIISFALNGEFMLVDNEVTLFRDDRCEFINSLEMVE